MPHHYNDVIMSTMASQITSLTIVYSTVYCRLKKTSKFRVTGLCAGNSPVTGEYPAQMACNAQNVSIWWRHHNWATKTQTRHNAPSLTTHFINEMGYQSNFRHSVIFPVFSHQVEGRLWIYVQHVNLASFGGTPVNLRVTRNFTGK